MNSGDSGDRASVASRLKQIAERVPHAPDIDTGEVAAVRQAVDRGTYRINPERIAEGLIRMDTALGRIQRPGVPRH